MAKPKDTTSRAADASKSATSKIKKVSPNGKWKDFFKLRGKLENGESFSVLAKSETAWRKGDEVEILERDQYGVKKMKKPGQGGGFGGGGKGAPREPESVKWPSFSVAYAKDLAVAGKIPIENIPEVSQMLFDTMKKLEKQ